MNCYEDPYDPIMGIQERHLPIRWGALQVLAFLGGYCVGLFLLLWITNMPVVQGVVIVVAAFLGAERAVWNRGKSRLKWFRDYLDRNVVGRKAHFFRTMDPPQSWVRIYGTFDDRNYAPEGILIPLGGWIKRPQVIRQNNPHGWKVTHYTRHPTFGILHVQIQDPYGDRVTLSMNEALSVLPIWTPLGYEWRYKIQLLSNQAATAKITADLIYRAIIDIDEKNRFGKSTQGREIKQSLAAGLLSVLSNSDPRYEEVRRHIPKEAAS